MTIERDVHRDTGSAAPEAEPVPAASTLGTDDEAGAPAGTEDRSERARAAERKIEEAERKRR